MATAASRPEKGAGEGAAPPRPGGAPNEDPALERLARAIAPGSLGELGLAIPLHHRLSTKLLTLIGVIALATVAAFFFAEISVQRHLLAQVVAESDLLSHTIRNALHRAMLQDRRPEAHLIMQDIGRETGIEMVRMMDGEGRITFSTDRAEIGKAVDRRADSFTRHHVIRPVAALVQATRRVARDQLELEVPVTWSGELGILAASFNEMTRSLRATKRALDELMHGLERQVRERTAALEAAQDQLVRTEKLTSLGKLSASIAHEINNPLAGILTFAKLMIRTLVERGPVSEADRKTLVKQLELVCRESQRCSTIVRNLLDFARERPLQLKDVDVDAAIDEMFTLVANQAAIQGVELVKDIVPLPPVEADFGQLRQAFVNVAMNAIEAMPGGGQLIVTTRKVPRDGAVEIVFADTGRGIPPEIVQRIFDPFFTTKEKGTGLGLSVVYGIVERHKGRVSVESEPGKGTRFVISLPAART